MTEFLNHTPARHGKSSAICECCEKRSRPVPVDWQDEPNLWDLALGWSSAPFPVNFEHHDGSRGSIYTCPACNKRLKRGETLKIRNGKAGSAKNNVRLEG